MLRLFVSVLLVFTGIKSVASDQQFSCKPIPGCHVSGCDPTQSSSGLQQNEVVVTCQPGNPNSGLSSDSAESESLAQKVQDLERSRDELINTVSIVEDKSKKMENEIADMKAMLIDLMQKNKDLVEERAFDRARISLLEAFARIKAGTIDPTPTVTSENGTTPSDVYTWGEWKWSSCSVSCGSGRRIVTRSCRNSLGDSVSTSLCAGGYRSGIANAGPCNTGRCSSYGSSFGVEHHGFQSQDEVYSWGKWTRSPCSLACGGGTATYTRPCLNERSRYGNGYASPSRCSGGYRDSTASSGPCNTQPCAVHYHFWGEWASTSCSTTCGLGTQKRQRECFNYKHRRVVVSPELCSGSDTEEVNCLMELCENENATVSTTASPTTQEVSTTSANVYSWGEWRQSSCTASCGNGTSTFTRLCLSRFGSPAFSINSCIGGFRASYARSGPCNTQPCVVNYHTWSQWTESPCSTTCGLGVQKRRRECWSSYYNRTVVPDHSCGGTSLDEMSCMLIICPREETTAAPTTLHSLLSSSSTATMGGTGIMDHIRNLLERAFSGIIFECDFDTVNDTCGLINDNSNNADWIQKQNTSAAYGGYLVVDTSRVSSRRIMATIKTPRLQNSGPACVSFRFFMTSSATATLKVKGRVYSGAGGETATTLEIFGSNSTNTNSWTQREVPLTSIQDPKFISVELEAKFDVHPTLSNPTIAVDDLVIKPRCSYSSV